eukprot:3402646-Alexandrium_andersonii.AAC.1
MGPQLAPILGWGRKPPAHKRRPMARHPQTAGLWSSAVFNMAMKRFFVGKRLAKLVDWRPRSRARP